MRNIPSRGLPGLSLVFFGIGLLVSRHCRILEIGYLFGIVIGMLIATLGAWVIMTDRLSLIARERESERLDMMERRVHSEMLLKAEIVALKKRIPD